MTRSTARTNRLLDEVRVEVHLQGEAIEQLQEELKQIRFMLGTFFPEPPSAGMARRD